MERGLRLSCHEMILPGLPNRESVRRNSPLRAANEKAQGPKSAWAELMKNRLPWHGANCSDPQPKALGRLQRLVSDDPDPKPPRLKGASGELCPRARVAYIARRRVRSERMYSLSKED